MALNPDLQLDLLRDREGVIDFDSEIANGAFKLRVPEQQLLLSKDAQPVPLPQVASGN